MSITGLPITKREVSHPATHSPITGLLHPQERGEVSHLYPFSYHSMPPSRKERGGLPPCPQSPTKPVLRGKSHSVLSTLGAS